MPAWRKLAFGSLLACACSDAGDDAAGDGASTGSAAASTTGIGDDASDGAGVDAGGTSTGRGDGDGDGGSAGDDGQTGATDDGAPPVSCELTDPLAPGDHERTIEHGGTTRRYFVHVPPSHDATTGAPLLLNMHGLTSTPAQQTTWSQMNAAADPRGWIVVYPEGIGRSWNAGTCCGDAAAQGIDDVGFLRAVVADASSALCVDPRRVYATGMSNGGHMSYRLACDAADLIAAVAPVAGAMRAIDCAPSRPVPVLAFHGVQDSIVPYQDDVSSIATWVANDACTGEVSDETFRGGDCRTWSGCAGGGLVELCTLDPMGHCWPGGDETQCFPILGEHSDAIDASERMLDFFEAFVLP